MRFMTLLKAALATGICLVLTSCASISVQSQLTKYKGQRVGLISTVGNTAIMSVHSSNPLMRFVHDKPHTYQQTFSQLKLNKTITHVATKTLKQKFPNLIIIPAQGQNIKSGMSTFHSATHPNRAFITGLMKKYRLDHLILITYGQVAHNQQIRRHRNDPYQQKFGINCVKEYGSGYAANYFATLKVFDVDGKKYAKKSFWQPGLNTLNTDQAEKYLGAKSWGRVANKKTLCQGLLNKKIPAAEAKRFLNWITRYYTAVTTRYLSH